MIFGKVFGQIVGQFFDQSFGQVLTRALGPYNTMYSSTGTEKRREEIKEIEIK